MKILKYFNKRDFISKYPEMKDATFILHYWDDRYNEMFTEEKRIFSHYDDIDIDKRYITINNELYTQNSSENIETEKDEKLNTIEDFLENTDRYVKEDFHLVLKKIINENYYQSRPYFSKLAKYLEKDIVSHLSKSINQYMADAFPYDLLEKLENVNGLEAYLEKRKNARKDYILPFFEYGKSYYIVASKELIEEFWEVINIDCFYSHQFTDQNSLKPQEVLELYEVVDFDFWKKLVERVNNFTYDQILKIKQIFSKHNENIDFIFNLKNIVDANNFVKKAEEFNFDKYELLEQLKENEEHDKIKEIIELNKESFEFEKLAEKKLIYIVTLCEIYNKPDPKRIREYSLDDVDYIIRRYILPTSDISFPKDLNKKAFYQYIKDEGYTHIVIG